MRKSKLGLLGAALLVVTVTAVAFVPHPSPIWAVPVAAPSGGSPLPDCTKVTSPNPGTNCNYTDPSATPCSSVAHAEPGTNCSSCTSISKCDLITQYVNPMINFLSALVGVAVVISIVIGGIQYSSSAGDPSKASAAKARIRNAIIALIVFVLLYAMINFLIPGGLV